MLSAHLNNVNLSSQFAAAKPRTLNPASIEPVSTEPQIEFGKKNKLRAWISKSTSKAPAMYRDFCIAAI
jgi:hypothetical protein